MTEKQELTQEEEQLQEMAKHFQGGANKTLEEVHESDAEYKKIIDDYKVARDKLGKKAKLGVYREDALLKEASQVQHELLLNTELHKRKRLNELNANVNLINTQFKKSVDFDARSNDVKKFEMKYTLADDLELRKMANNIESHDILELNLLRMELKKRGLSDLDFNVKMYIMTNDVGGLGETEREMKNSVERSIAMYSSASDLVIIDGQVVVMDTIKRELSEMVR